MTQVVNTKQIASLSTPQTFLLENSARESFTISNNSTAILYVLFGPGIPSSSNFTYEIVGSAADTLISPYVTSGFRGRVTGVWASANGTAQLSETLRDDSSEHPPGQATY